MHNLLLIIYTLFYRSYSLFFHRKLVISSAKFLNTRVHGSSNNKILLSNGTYDQSSITASGANNIIELSTSIYKSKIKIFGNNNKLIIHAKYVNFAELVIRGNNCTVEIGVGTTLGSGVIVCMGNHKSIIIGHDVMLADNIDIWNSDTHPIFDANDKLINPSSSISIGNNVWLGKGVRVLKGVVIGDGAVVGMGSIVTKSVEPNTLNAGIPSCTIKSDIHYKREFITNYE